MLRGLSLEADGSSAPMSLGILKSQTCLGLLKRLRHDNLLSVEIDIGPPQTEVRKCIAVSAPLQAQALTVYGTSYPYSACLDDDREYASKAD